jgi:5-(carboxyamino)imidazole ribonucleotide mutase
MRYIAPAAEVDMAALVAVFVGSDSDWPVMQGCLDLLDRFGIPWERVTASAHRQPDAVRAHARRLLDSGAKVFIAGAGYAAALPGVLAAEVPVPVIGVPIDSSSLGGLDSLLSMAQMPGGVPVATVTIGKAGASNAAVLAAEILALGDAAVRARLMDFRYEMAGRKGGSQ